MTEFSGEELEESFKEGLPTFSSESEKIHKGGRPTITDEFLAFGRNQWRCFFEECWPEVGWPLSRIRMRRSSTIKDVQNVFKKIAGRPLCDHAKAFLRGEPQDTTVAALRKQRIASTKCRDELQNMRKAHSELERACAEAKRALEQTDKIKKTSIRVEATRRRRLLNKSSRTINAQETKYRALECTLCAQETFLYCSELLDFLQGGRRAVTPKSLANALAGLPDMRWRQSDARCSKLPEDGGTQYPYAVFQLMNRVSRRIRDRRIEFSVDSFQIELMKLPKKHRYPGEFLLAHLRDLRLTIEEACKTKDVGEFIPYALTRTFLKNACRPKSSLDSVLDSQEKASTARR